MKISLPEDLRLFTASHRNYGKCQIEFSAFTGTVVSKEERTTTRVYGDSRGVGSRVSVDQALWIQFEDGSEQCIDIQNNDTRLARPGHTITFLNAKNSQTNASIYVAFFNCATKEFHYFQYDSWVQLFWRNKSGFLQVLRAAFFRSLFISLSIGTLLTLLSLSSTYVVQLGIIGSVLVATGVIMIQIIIPVILAYSFGAWNTTNKVKATFKKQINQIMESFREQLGQGS